MTKIAGKVNDVSLIRNQNSGFTKMSFTLGADVGNAETNVIVSCDVTAAELMLTKGMNVEVFGDYGKDNYFKAKKIIVTDRNNAVLKCSRPNLGALVVLGIFGTIILALYLMGFIG